MYRFKDGEGNQVNARVWFKALHFKPPPESDQEKPNVLFEDEEGHLFNAPLLV